LERSFICIIRLYISGSCFLFLSTEFRDGNVPAGFEQLRIFKEAFSNLPEGVKKVYFRSDSVAYQHDLLQYCDEGKNERFGKIGFAIGHDIMKSFRKAILSDMEAYGV